MEVIGTLKAFGEVSAIGLLAFLMWEMLKILKKILTNHLEHLQTGVDDILKQGEKVEFHVAKTNELLQKLIDK